MSVNLLVTKAIDAYLDALVPVEELIATRRAECHGFCTGGETLVVEIQRVTATDH